MKGFLLIGIFFFCFDCHTTVIKMKEAEFSRDKFNLSQNDVNQVSVVFGYYEYSKPVKSNCAQGKTKAIIFHRDWRDKLAYFFIGGIYSSKSVSVLCEE